MPKFNLSPNKFFLKKIAREKFLLASADIMLFRYQHFDGALLLSIEFA